VACEVLGEHNSFHYKWKAECIGGQFGNFWTGKNEEELKRKAFLGCKTKRP
jgi:hypothetical protein